MSWENNIGNHPENFGFSNVAEIELSAPDYSFDLALVLKNDLGYYLSTDSGCSCPIPWESHTVDDFTGPLTAEQAREELTSLWEGAYGGGYDKPSFDEALSLIV